MVIRRRRGKQEVGDVLREEPAISQVQSMFETSARYNKRGKRVRRDQWVEEESPNESIKIIQCLERIKGQMQTYGQDFEVHE